MKKLLTTLLLASSMQLTAQNTDHIQAFYHQAQYRPIGLRDEHIRDILAKATNTADSLAGSYRGDATDKFYRQYFDFEVRARLPGFDVTDTLEGELMHAKDAGWLKSFAAAVNGLGLDEYKVDTTSNSISFSYYAKDAKDENYIDFIFQGNEKKLTHAWITYNGYLKYTTDKAIHADIEYHEDGFVSGTTNNIFGPDKFEVFMNALYQELRSITQ
jgi:hypothetical protein